MMRLNELKLYAKIYLHSLLICEIIKKKKYIYIFNLEAYNLKTKNFLFKFFDKLCLLDRPVSTLKRYQCNFETTSIRIVYTQCT